MAGGRPPKFKTKEELEKALQEYKDYLLNEDKPPTIAGLAYYTGIDRQTIYNYSEKNEFFGTIKSFRDWVMMTYEEAALTHSGSGVIFLLKNYGYTDRQEVKHEGKSSITIVNDI